MLGNSVPAFKNPVAADGMLLPTIDLGALEHGSMTLSDRGYIRCMCFIVFTGSVICTRRACDSMALVRL